MGTTNCFASSVNAIVTMYSTGTTIMNASHSRSDRLAYLSTARLLADEME